MGIKAEITCLCGRSKDTVTLAASALPVETIICHCNICRYTSGVLGVSYLNLESAPPISDHLRAYQSSAKMQRYFCETCGSHLFTYSPELDEWDVAAGVIETPQPGKPGKFMETTKLIQHEFVSDTLDGGLAPCWAKIQNREVAYFAQGPDRLPLQLDDHGRSIFPTAQNDADKQNYPSLSTESSLHAKCHCGGVEFMISKPNAQSSQVLSPWPDLIVPYHSGSSKNEKDVKWWLRSNNTKYFAGTCACRSCRLGSGFSVQTFAFIPKPNLSSVEGQPLSFETGTLRQYNSSPGCYREFCSKCGATVFWHCDERPDLIDVSVGLLRAPEGARAENWLEWWTERVSFREDAIDLELIEALEKGLANIAVSQ